jgi:hypothetical protein
MIKTRVMNLIKLLHMKIRQGLKSRRGYTPPYWTERDERDEEAVTPTRFRTSSGLPIQKNIRIMFESGNDAEKSHFV